MKEPILSALNQQLNRELYSAYLYLSMAAYFDAHQLKGFAHWMHMQVKEEFEHAMRFYHYIIERGEQVQCLVLEAPPSEWSSVVNVFEAVLHHEQDVTKLIHTLVDLALQYKDDATHKFLQWFVAEQREEEFSAGQVLKKTKIAAEDSDAFVLLDQELEKRKI
ncbi:MAG: ferritin [Gammaproteobacteria bacterium RIFCSPHIGHO2_02_FULL_42_13]|nr:MAG: ferritin [Gammaproteobacteria bacterium RIFCSPHIGHO2_02_FULL_42_13]OGT70553.1 MAG: ferritin [Gammaproteobacteria bacterium RIFCSPLOWO2_02_FULL_42_9]